MNIAIASDHAGFDLKNEIISLLQEKKFSIIDFGTDSNESVDYPDFAYTAAESVASAESDIAIIICGSGVGVSITANKVKGVRAANCFNEEMAALARQHNNANVLTLGSRFIEVNTAKNMVNTFINTDFEGGRHQRRVDKVHSLTGC